MNMFPSIIILNEILNVTKFFFGKEASEYFRKQLQTLFRKNVFVELETAMIVSSQTIA